MLSLQPDGAEQHRGAAEPIIADLLSALSGFARGQAGVRIRSSTLRSWLDPTGAIGSIAAGAIGQHCRPVRAILFDKTADSNWSLGWHQDRTICVRERVEVEGFGPWTIKAGMQHVEPPFELLTGMVTLRVHLDDVPATNAPLLIAPGSHAIGRVAVKVIGDVVRERGIIACLASAGDVWLYSSPIIHASEVASVPARRRVLQVDYSAAGLPGGLTWLGI